MTQPESRPTLVFDGDCGFCTTAVTWLVGRLARRDGSGPTTVPWQFADLDRLGVTAERAQREVLWVEPDGTVRGGAEAVAAWLRLTGRGWAVLGRAMALPVVRTVAAAVYGLVARNRHRLPGGTPACALPPTNGRSSP